MTGLVRAGFEKLTRPLELVSGVLMATLERGCLRSLPLEPSDMAAFLRCTLPPLEREEALLLIAAALWATLQVR